MAAPPKWDEGGDAVDERGACRDWSWCRAHPRCQRSLAALFLIGILTFGRMYTFQPLLPIIDREYGRCAAGVAELSYPQNGVRG